MDKKIVEILKHIKNTYGESIFLNKSRFNSVLSDYAKGQYKGEINLLNTTLALGLYSEIKRSQDEYNKVRSRYIKRLETEYFFNEEQAVFAVDAWAVVAEVISDISQGSIHINMNDNNANKSNKSQLKDEIRHKSDFQEPSKHINNPRNVQMGKLIIERKDYDIGQELKVYLNGVLMDKRIPSEGAVTFELKEGNYTLQVKGISLLDEPSESVSFVINGTSKTVRFRCYLEGGLRWRSLIIIERIPDSIQR